MTADLPTADGRYRDRDGELWLHDAGFWTHVPTGASLSAAADPRPISTWGPFEPVDPTEYDPAHRPAGLPLTPGLYISSHVAPETAKPFALTALDRWVWFDHRGDIANSDLKQLAPMVRLVPLTDRERHRLADRAP